MPQIKLSRFNITNSPKTAWKTENKGYVNELKAEWVEKGQIVEQQELTATVEGIVRMLYNIPWRMVDFERITFRVAATMNYKIGIVLKTVTMSFPYEGWKFRRYLIIFRLLFHLEDCVEDANRYLNVIISTRGCLSTFRRIHFLKSNLVKFILCHCFRVKELYSKRIFRLPRLCDKFPLELLHIRNFFPQRFFPS